jgi:hypothetical protein
MERFCSVISINASTSLVLERMMIKRGTVNGDGEIY